MLQNLVRAPWGLLDCTRRDHARGSSINRLVRIDRNFGLKVEWQRLIRPRVRAPPIVNRFGKRAPENVQVSDFQLTSPIQALVIGWWRNERDSGTLFR